MVMKLTEVYNIRYFGPDDNLRGIILTVDTKNGSQFLFNDMGHLHTDNPIDIVIDYDDADLYEEADKQLDKLAEVYNIRYSGPDDNLRGIILTVDTKNGSQFLFNDMGHLHTDNPIDIVIDYDDADLYEEADKQLDVSSKPLIRSGDLIMLSGLAQAAIIANGDFELEFFLFGVFYEYVIFKNDYDKEPLSVPLQKIIHGDGGRRQLKINYAIFDNAVEAHVKVKLTRVDSTFDFDGIIHAMTSAIEDPQYTSILYSSDYDHKIRLEPEDEMILKLSRHIVVVPLGSQLILHFGLYVDDNQELKTVTFVAKEEVAEAELTSSIQEIVYSKGVIQVEVNWRSKRHPMKMNNGYGLEYHCTNKDIYN